MSFFEALYFMIVTVSELLAFHNNVGFYHLIPLILISGYESGNVSYGTLKVRWPTLITYSNWTPTFKRCVVKCGSNNAHQKDTCIKEI